MIPSCYLSVHARLVAVVLLLWPVALVAAEDTAAALGGGVDDWALWAGKHLGAGLAMLWVLVLRGDVYLKREYSRVVDENDRIKARLDRLERVADSATALSERLTGR